MRADNTHHLRKAVQRRQHDTRERALTALAEHQRRNTPLTVAGLARAAGVTRSWIYTQPDLLAVIQNNRATTPAPQTRNTTTEQSWQQRLGLAHNRIRELTAEIHALRNQLARAHGQLRAARTTSRHTHPTINPDKDIDKDMSTPQTRS